MSEVKLNGFVNGWSGRFGNAVARQCGERVILVNRPQKKVAPTEAMVKHRHYFREAAAYARLSLADPLVNAAYAIQVKHKKFNSAYTAAIRDYILLPRIDAVDTNAYFGKQGDIILVRVPDNFKIVVVQVTILLADSSVLEGGVGDYLDGTLRWIYTAQATAAMLPGMKIIVTAKDRPGKVVRMEVAL